MPASLVSQQQDLRLQGGRLLIGDCLEVMSWLKSDSIDMVFADPPYNLQLSSSILRRPDTSVVSGVRSPWDRFQSFHHYDRFTKKWLLQVQRLLKPNGSLWVIGTYHNIFRIGKILQDVGFWIYNDILWIKDNPMPNFQGSRFTNAHETLIWCGKTHRRPTFNYNAMKVFNDGKQMRSDWYLPLCQGAERLKRDKKALHPTQKPLSLLYRIVLASTNGGDCILDPFFGTGTTGVAAKTLGRTFLGIEENRPYAMIAKKRIEATSATPKSFTLPFREPKKLRRIPFGSLVSCGMVTPGTPLWDRSKRHSALVTADGSLVLTATGQRGSLHQLAALVTGKTSCNGWGWWYIEQEGKLVSIDDLRNTLRQQDTETSSAHLLKDYG